MKQLFPSQTFQTRYRSGDAYAKPCEFYNQVLPCTKLYRRAVGFFSSTSFLEISHGILSLVKNDGKMQLITSPRLNEDDVAAIKKGYESRENIYLRAFAREMTLPKTINEQNRLNILANLIEMGILEIKIAVTKNPEFSMYHEKIGLFVDDEENKVAISGSMNESETAISENFESFQVFCGWYEGDAERVKICEDDFNAMWQNKQNALEVFDFPELPTAFIQKYKTSDNITETINRKIVPLAFESFCDDEKLSSQLFFDFDKKVSPRIHQIRAIEKFIENDFQCLFAMATGTGKTLTSLFAANELSAYVQLDSILIIVPLKDLVDQWEKDVRAYFSGEVICVRSGVDWKEKISDLSLLRLLKKDNRQKRLVVITTYDSFSLNNEKLIDVLGENALIIADEVHKFGASSYSKKLPQNIRYRIGLSATPKRPYDDKGTKAVFDYFCPNGNAYEFSIKDAINNNMLCHYNYYPIVVRLTDDEMEAYDLISEKVSRLSMVINNSTNTTVEDEQKLEQLLKERHRIIERAENKKEMFFERMIEEIKNYKDRTIVFCPDGQNESGEDLLTDYKTELWKILIANGKIVSMSEYVQGTNRKVIEAFSANAIHILFAKQRLNEGIDIPAAKRAFFISSSTSEREFIQRRGRVLRKSPGKTLAEIFDFIVVPPDKKSQYASSIINNEIKRAMDFAATADNYSEIEETLRAWL